MMEKITALDLENAVRSLGLPQELHVDSEPDVYPVEGTKFYISRIPTFTLTFQFVLTPEIKAYLPEMKSRYDIWTALRKQIETGISALDD